MPPECHPKRYLQITSLDYNSNLILTLMWGSKSWPFLEVSLFYQGLRRCRYHISSKRWFEMEISAFHLRRDFKDQPPKNSEANRWFVVRYVRCLRKNIESQIVFKVPDAKSEFVEAPVPGYFYLRKDGLTCK